MNGKTIFLVEDETKIAELLRDYLVRDGFEVTVFNDGSAVVEETLKTPPALMILDLMLPGKDGLSICREVRQSSDVPIIMVTARVDEIDRLLGLELGADDYVCKPFSPREVVARVRTILRRAAPRPVSENEDELRYRDVRLLLDRYICEVGSQRLELTPVEFRMLKVLLTRPGRVFSRDQLMQASYDDHRIVSDRTIDSHIKNLRRKIGDVTDDTTLIHSIYGVGYKIE